MLDGPDLMRILRKRWWLVVILAIVGGAGGYAYSHSRSGTYTASRGLTITGEVPNPVVVSEADTPESAATIVQTQVDLLNSSAIADAVKSRLHGLKVSLAVSASATTSNFVTLTTTASSPSVATAALNAMIESYDTLTRDEQTSVLGDAQRVTSDELRADRSALAKTKNPGLERLFSQEIVQLTTTNDELLASSALGNTQAQVVGGAHLAGPIFSPTRSQGILIGAAIGLLLACALAVSIRRPVLADPRKITPAPAPLVELDTVS